MVIRMYKDLLKMINRFILILSLMSLVASCSKMEKIVQQISEKNEIESMAMEDNSITTVVSYAKPEDAGFDSQKLQLIDEFINNDIKNGFPGAGLLVVRNGKIIKQTVYGYKLKYDEQGNLLDNFDPMLSDTMFDLASNTKMYATNYAVMHLVSENKLKLDNPISVYIPSYTGCDKNGQCRESRTVINLLKHDAGYARDLKLYNPQMVPKNIYSQNRHRTEQIITSVLPFESSVGGMPVYGDIDYILLGMIVEKITNKRLDLYVNEVFYKPLGLKHTTFNPLKNGFAKNSCAATEIDGNTRGFTIQFPNIRRSPLQCQVHDEKSFYSMWGISGHAGLFSNLEDLAVLTQVMLNNGRYADLKFWDSAVEKLFTMPNAKDPSYGLGWRRAGEKNTRSLEWFGPYASELAVGHTGWTGTVTVIDPKYNLAIILLTNKKHSDFVNGNFTGDFFETGKYSKIITMVYEAMNGVN